MIVVDSANKTLDRTVMNNNKWACYIFAHLKITNLLENAKCVIQNDLFHKQEKNNLLMNFISKRLVKILIHNIHACILMRFEEITIV